MSAISAEDKVEYSSGSDQNIMIELFTSQGCSSCPPAENWLNSLKNSDELWNKVIPLAFHVDYWDRLGWPDPYANHAYSMRQYRHQQQKHIKSVYTPGVIVNGYEWRGWIRGSDYPELALDAGVLSFSADLNNVNVVYSNFSDSHILNVALLGMGIVTHVERGENNGRQLQQEFVVLSLEMYSAAKTNEDGEWNIPLPVDSSPNIKQHALALWISDVDDISPIQSTGYWLPSEWVSAKD